jgi:hypothetical protein
MADDQLAQYLRDVLAWLRGPGEPADWAARLLERSGRWHVRVEEGPTEFPPAPHRFTATVLQSGGRPPQEASLEAVGPGLYETDLGTFDAEAASVAVRADQDPDARAYLSVPGRAPREYERFGVDHERLEAIVRAGGGRVHSSVASLAEAVARAEAPYEKPVGVYLVWAAGAAVLALVAGRLTGRL